MLSEGRPGSKDRAFPIDDVDGDDEDKGDTEEDRVAVLEVSWRLVMGANIGEEWSGRDRQDTGQEISRPSVAAGGGGRVRTVGTDHVVDRRHVYTVVCDSNDGGEYHGSNPMDWRSQAGPSKSNQADRQAWRGEQEPP